MTYSSKPYIPYEYKNAPVPGGGFVTGFCFHPVEREILYARTDIGGVYRYNFETKSWTSLMNHVKATQKWESYPLSIALDPANSDWLYIASGDWENNYLSRSKDRGETFEYFKIPAGVHGNAPGRGTGERLLVDPSNSSIIYYGSQTEGLLISENYGETWTKLGVKEGDKETESDIAFVWLDPRSSRDGRCQTIVVSTSGKENSPKGNIRGKSLYISTDGGKSFKAMPGQPSETEFGNYPGFVGQRAYMTGNYLFVTMGAVGFSWQGWHGYACDMGGEQKGCILRYELTDTGEILDHRYVTPELDFIGGGFKAISELCGFGGINGVNDKPGELICSTQSCGKGDAVLYSVNYGEDWIPILHNLEIGQMDFTEVPYMKPQYNGNANLIHWLSDIKIDPFDSNRAVFNTGTGVFMTENLQDGKLLGKKVVWRPRCKGIEETVHLNVYSPPAGEVKLIDIIGDLGGFAFTDLNKPCENSFADERGNRYITCLNADYTDNNPLEVAVTSRGNWKGKTTGGLIWSDDQCKTWLRLPDPLGITDKIDKLIEAIRKPNTNSGWTALSADGKTLVWSVGEGNILPIDTVVYTEDLGKTWHKTIVYDLEGKNIEDTNIFQEISKLQDTSVKDKSFTRNFEPKAQSLQAVQEEIDINIDKEPIKTLKVISDRVDPEVFYGFGDGSLMYISTDRARTFYQILVSEDFPKLELGGMDGRMPAEIRAESGKEGIVWISTGDEGLWKLKFDKDAKKADFLRISKKGDKIYRQGMGKEASKSTCKTLYVNGVIDGDYGFYRSLDEGMTWERINDENQMYGDIRSIVGDPREFGRFYIATGSRGVLWGQPK